MGKWKLHLIAIAIIAAIISFGASYLITPKFKSSSILYPVNLPTFSEESNTEQMLQIIESTDIKKKIFKAFDLAKHYDIDTLDKQWFSYLNLEFEGNVSFSKTEYEAVEIVVLDKDPQVASNMIDSIIKYYNDKVRQMHREKHEEVVLLKSQLIDRLKTQIDSLEKIKDMHQSKYGIYDFGVQSKEVNRRYIKLVSEGRDNSQPGVKLSEMITNLKEKGIESERVIALLWGLRNSLNNAINDMNNEVIEVKKEITYCQVVTQAFPADKKSTPIRWIIVFFSTIATLVAAVVAITFIESKKK